MQGAIRNGEWLHVAAVTGPGGMQLYVDGILAATNAVTAGFSFNRTPEHCWIGRTEGNDGANFFAGQVAEFRVWAVRRSVEQIRADMFRPLTGAEPGLHALWNFQRVEGTTVRDLSPNHRDAKLVGDAVVCAGLAPAKR